jgi:hypothetical protein
MYEIEMSPVFYAAVTVGASRDNNLNTPSPHRNIPHSDISVTVGFLEALSWNMLGSMRTVENPPDRPDANPLGDILHDNQS